MTIDLRIAGGTVVTPAGQAPADSDSTNGDSA